MPPKRKATYVTRAAQRRRLDGNNPHPSQLTAHSAAQENLQSSTGANPPTAQGARSVNADWLANCQGCYQPQETFRNSQLGNKWENSQ